MLCIWAKEISLAKEVVKELNLVSGQTVSDTLITAIRQTELAIIQSKLAIEKATKQ